MFQKGSFIRTPAFVLLCTFRCVAHFSVPFALRLCTMQHGFTSVLTGWAFLGKLRGPALLPQNERQHHALALRKDPCFDLQFSALSLKQTSHMKQLYTALLFSAFVTLLASCSVFNKPKYGCGTDGRNVGAEKLLDGSATKKEPKFKGG